MQCDHRRLRSCSTPRLVEKVLQFLLRKFLFIVVGSATTSALPQSNESSSLSILGTTEVSGASSERAKLRLAILTVLEKTSMADRTAAKPSTEVCFLFLHAVKTVKIVVRISRWTSWNRVLSSDFHESSRLCQSSYRSSCLGHISLLRLRLESLGSLRCSHD